MRIPKVPTYLVKGLNSRYYFRIVVPLDVRQALGGQREYRRALGTTDMRKALSRAWGMAAQYQTLFERCRMGKDPNDPLKDSVVSTELLIERKISPDGTVTENITFDDPDVQKDKERLEAYEELQRKKDSQPFKHSVRDDVPEKSEQGATTSNTRRARRNKEQKTSEPEATFADKTAPLMLSGLVDQYAEDKETTEAWNPNTKKENESSYNKLVKLVGDQPIDAVTRADANRLLKTLKEMPSKKGGTLSASGINKKMGMMSSLYIYANEHGLTTNNPFKKLQLTVDTLPEDAQDVYTLDELKALFDPTYFKIDPKRPSRYWIPIIMALGGGCRPGELAQLTEEDIVEIDGISCIYINDLMQRKSKNAIRTIPITDNLIDLGFLRFVEQCRQELKSNKKLTDRRLFRELNPNRPKKAGAVSSWWNETHHKHCKILRTTQVKLGRVTKERHVSLYSLRHNVQTIFREKGVRETIAAEIVGHEKGTTTGYNVYAKKGQLKPLIDALDKVDYGDSLANVPVWE